MLSGMPSQPGLRRKFCSAKRSNWSLDAQPAVEVIHVVIDDEIVLLPQRLRQQNDLARRGREGQRTSGQAWVPIAYRRERHHARRRHTGWRHMRGRIDDRRAGGLSGVMQELVRRR